MGFTIIAARALANEEIAVFKVELPELELTKHTVNDLRYPFPEQRVQEEYPCALWLSFERNSSSPTIFTDGLILMNVSRLDLWLSS